MNIIKCKNGHFYDSDRFMLCPHCGAEALISKTETSKSLFHKEKRGTIPKGYQGCPVSAVILLFPKAKQSAG